MKKILLTLATPWVLCVFLILKWFDNIHLDNMKNVLSEEEFQDYLDKYPGIWEIIR